MGFGIRAPKKQPPSLITLLPDEVVVDIIARVPRFYYPTLSLVSRYFRSLVASPDLYSRRSLLGCTESFIYAVLRNMDTSSYHLYVLRREATRNCMVAIPSLPPILHYQGNFVTFGSRIYGVDGLSHLEMGPSAFSIDCRSHTLQPISRLPKPMADTVAGIINGKMYIVGEGYDYESWNKRTVMVFDIETQMWEPERTNLDIKINQIRWSGGVVINSANTFAFPEEEWETDAMLNFMKWKNYCVIDNVLYSYDTCFHKLRTYDPKQRHMGVVEGVGKLLPKETLSCESNTVNYGGKLAVFLTTKVTGTGTMKIWCAEIALERRQGGEIWGKVECCDVLIDGRFILDTCLRVRF